MTTFATVQKVKLDYNDLKAMGIVGSRFDLRTKIQSGRLPKPNKDGSSVQARIWWWAADVQKAMEREKLAAAE